MDLFVISIPLGIILIVFFAQYFGRLVISYEVTQKGIGVLLLGIVPIVRVTYGEMAAAKLVSWNTVLSPRKLGPFATLRLGNRLIGRGVLITRTRGLFKQILISPTNPVKFVEEIIRFKKESGL